MADYGTCCLRPRPQSGSTLRHPNTSGRHSVHGGPVHPETKCGRLVSTVSSTRKRHRWQSCNRDRIVFDVMQYQLRFYGPTLRYDTY